MKYCILNKQTNICDNIVILDSAEQFQETETHRVADNQEGHIGWTWDQQNEKWTDPSTQFDDELLAESFRYKRKLLLAKHVDSINPIRWNSMSQEEQQKYIDYRQALLDVPSQPGFPRTHTLPKAP